jgi:CheY-like chemotaxis protein
MIGVSRDVTAQVAAEAALAAARAEAEAATQAKADFLANASHELLTPLNGVLGALHLLARESLSLEGRQFLVEANDCGRMLSHLLNDVLDFSKIEAGQLDLAPQRMNVNEALQAITGLLGVQARAKGVEMRCEVPAEAIWIEADPTRLRQAMFNLLGNAVKFTADGHVAARLIAGPVVQGRRHVRLQIEDTGIGMTADAQSQLFERFRQGENDTARRFAGMGLGLSITQALAHMMGGEVGFTSTEGEGSTFWLAFDAPDARAAPVATLDDGMLSGVNILLVEDNPTNRLVASTMLSRLGATIAEAEDGVFGVEAARVGAYDLILMDIQMPRMDGIEATRAIRRLNGAPGRVPILAVTANAMTGQREQYLAAGMNGVVAKPIAPGVLLSEIVRVLSEEDAALAV